MFRRILVPLDGTQRSEAALELARTFAVRFDAKLYLLHVEPEWAHLKATADVERRMDRITMELRAEGVQVCTVSECGRADEGIRAAAEADDTDLIVLAPGHHSLVEALRHPSVTRRLLPQTSVPVLVAPEVPPEGEPALLDYHGGAIIVPLDGSSTADEALPPAVRLARMYGRPLLLVHVVQYMPIVGGGPESYRLSRETLCADEAEAHRYLREMRERLERYESVEVETMVIPGDPAETLVTVGQAHPGSLLVMSTHGRTGLRRLLMGSVALEVARKTAIPVLVVPPAKHAESPGKDTVATR